MAGRISKQQIIPNHLSYMIFKKSEQEIFLPNDVWLRLMLNEGGIEVLRASSPGRMEARTGLI